MNTQLQQTEQPTLDRSEVRIEKLAAIADRLGQFLENPDYEIDKHWLKVHQAFIMTLREIQRQTNYHRDVSRAAADLAAEKEFRQEQRREARQSNERMRQKWRDEHPGETPWWETPPSQPAAKPEPVAPEPDVSLVGWASPPVTPRGKSGNQGIQGYGYSAPQDKIYTCTPEQRRRLEYTDSD